MKSSLRPSSELGGYQHMRRMVLAVLVVVLFAALLFGQSTFAPETPVHETIEMFGVLLIFLGIVGRLWSTLYIGGRKSSEVVTGGPYSITRNPLYVFSTVPPPASGRRSARSPASILFALLCAGAFHIVILREERYLKEVLGAPYQAYLARVPRFFPKLSLYQEGDTGSFKPRLLLTTCSTGWCSWWRCRCSRLIDGAQQSGMLPVLFTLP